MCASNNDNISSHRMFFEGKELCLAVSLAL